MRLAVIVSEFPKTSETFVLRDLVKFRQLGADIRLYHLAPYRKRETLHDFARPVRDWVRRLPMLPLTTAAGVAADRPRVVARLLADMMRGLGGEPVLLAKSLALTPRMLAIAEDAAIWGADHVHAAFAAHPATAAWMAGRLTGIPYSVSCHAHDIFTTHAMLDRKLGEAAFVRTISDYNKAYLLRHVPGLTPRQIRVIRCGMDLSTLAPLPAPQPDAAFRMLFVGRLAPQKGIDTLLRAMTEPNAAPHWRLTVIGDGPERRRLAAMARSLGVAPRVSWLGARNFEAVAQAYGEADVVVAPSVIGPGGRTEGIPNVLMEALACRRPVVASHVTGMAELVIDGQTGLLVPPGDPAALAAALARVEADPAAALAMAAAGRRLVERAYDLNVTSRQQYAAFLDHVRWPVDREAVA